MQDLRARLRSGMADRDGGPTATIVQCRIDAGQRAKELVGVAAHSGRRRRERAAVEADAKHAPMLPAPRILLQRRAPRPRLIPIACADGLTTLMCSVLNPNPRAPPGGPGCALPHSPRPCDRLRAGQRAASRSGVCLRSDASGRLRPGSTNPAVQFVVQKEGVIRIVQNGSLLPDTFLDLSDAITTDGERGLMSAWPSRPIRINRPLFRLVCRHCRAVSWSRAFTGRATHSSPTGPPVRPAMVYWLARVPAPGDYHYSGNLVFGPDGLLFVGIGRRRRSERRVASGADAGNLLGSCCGSTSTSATRIRKASTSLRAILSSTAAGRPKYGPSVCATRGGSVSTTPRAAEPAPCSSPTSARMRSKS